MLNTKTQTTRAANPIPPIHFPAAPPLNSSQKQSKARTPLPIAIASLYRDVHVFGFESTASSVALTM